jgi:hypothetical protein
MTEEHKTKDQTLGNIFVLITVSGGIVNEVVFYFEAEQALLALASFVKEMNIERQDAVIYNRKGFFANAKDFLDDNDQYVINPYIFDKK